MSNDILEAFDLDTATKDELEAFAQANFGVDIDKRKKVDELRDEVAALVTEGEPVLQPEDSQDDQAAGQTKIASSSDTEDKREYLLNTATGVVFAATKHLKKRGDLIACDKDGKPV